MAKENSPATLWFGRTAVMTVAICAAGVSLASLDARFIGAGAANGAKPACVRRVVSNEKPVTNATWRVTGLGVFTAYVNGRAIGGPAIRIRGNAILRLPLT